MIVCSRCSKDNQDHYKFCLGCGAELPRESSKPRSFSAPTPPGGTPAPGRETNAPQALQVQGGKAEALASAPQLELALQDPTALLMRVIMFWYFRIGFNVDDPHHDLFTPDQPRKHAWQ